MSSVPRWAAGSTEAEMLDCETLETAGQHTVGTYGLLHVVDPEFGSWVYYLGRADMCEGERTTWQVVWHYGIVPPAPHELERSHILDMLAKHRETDRERQQRELSEDLAAIQQIRQRREPDLGRLL